MPRDTADAVGSLDLSATAEADGDLSCFDNHRYLAATVGVLEHALEPCVVFQHVDEFEGYLAAGEILTGPRSVGSEILPKNEDFFCRHKLLLHLVAARVASRRQ